MVGAQVLLFCACGRYINFMAHRTSQSSKKRKQHTPQVRKVTQMTPAEEKDLKKRQKAIKARTEERSVFATPWFVIPLLAALITSPAIAIVMAVVGCLVAIVGACLSPKDKMRGQLLAAGLGAILGSLPYLVYEILKWTGVIG